jgi:hypothetical protein
MGRKAENRNKKYKKDKTKEGKNDITVNII